MNERPSALLLSGGLSYSKGNVIQLWWQAALLTQCYHPVCHTGISKSSLIIKSQKRDEKIKYC